ncbi:hypothetical protein ACWDSL_53535, partial [Streptomyces sp. NPDC000941]
MLIVEAAGIALLNWILGIVVDRQQMSLAGLDTDAMSIGTWVAGGLFGLYLLLCAVVLLRAGVRDRAPGRAARILLITCAVVHALVGAFVVGLVGWTAFALMMVMLGLIVLSLLSYDESAGTAEPDAAAPGPTGARGAAGRAAPPPGPAGGWRGRRKR